MLLKHIIDSQLFSWVYKKKAKLNTVWQALNIIRLFHQQGDCRKAIRGKRDICQHGVQCVLKKTEETGQWRWKEVFLCHVMSVGHGW